MGKISKDSWFVAFPAPEAAVPLMFNKEASIVRAFDHRVIDVEALHSVMADINESLRQKYRGINERRRQVYGKSREHPPLEAPRAKVNTAVNVDGSFDLFIDDDKKTMLARLVKVEGVKEMIEKLMQAAICD